VSTSHPRPPGVDPDPRFTLANERTYLAWTRTSLAVIAGGLAAAQFLKVGAPLAVALGMTVIALGASLSFSSYAHWQRNEHALRFGQPLPPSVLPRLLVYLVAMVAIAAFALAGLALTSR
jgi:putative membrane protein